MQYWIVQSQTRHNIIFPPVEVVLTGLVKVFPFKPNERLIEMLINKLHHQWKIYKDARGKHRWRVTHKKNGEIIGASTQGYVKRKDCIANAELFGYRP